MWMRAYLFSNPLCLADVLVVLSEDAVDLLHGGNLLFPSLVSEGAVTEGATGLLEALEVLLDPLDILETEFCGDNVHVAAGVDVALDVDDLGIIEGADDLEDTVDGTDVGQESVSETGTR